MVIDRAEAFDRSAGQDDSITATYAHLVGVGVVERSQFTPSGPGATADQPAMGFPFTTFTVRFDRLVKGGSEDVFTAQVAQEGAPGVTFDDRPDAQLMEVGKRYFLTARLKTDPTEGYFVYPLSVDPVLIESEEQEDALVEHWANLVIIEVSPEAAPSSDASPEDRPSPEATAENTSTPTAEASPVETNTEVATSSPTEVVPTEVPATLAPTEPVVTDASPAL